MAKYGAKASEKVEQAMHEMHEGTLKTGSGKKVTSKKQAVAIGLSEAREAGGGSEKEGIGCEARTESEGKAGTEAEKEIVSFLRRCAGQQNLPAADRHFFSLPVTKMCLLR